MQALFAWVNVDVTPWREHRFVLIQAAQSCQIRTIVCGSLLHPQQRHCLGCIFCSRIIFAGMRCRINQTPNGPVAAVSDDIQDGG